MPTGKGFPDPTLSKTAFTYREQQTIHNLRVLAAINLLQGRGIVSDMDYSRDEIGLNDVVDFNLQVQIPDSVSVDLQNWITSEVGELLMQYAEDWEKPMPVERPTRGEMTFVDAKSGLNFVVVQEYDAYVLKTTCIDCGRVFSESLRHYNHREITVGAFRIGYAVGAHVQRHEGFKEIINAAKKEE